MFQPTNWLSFLSWKLFRTKLYMLWALVQLVFFCEFYSILALLIKYRCCKFSWAFLFIEFFYSYGISFWPQWLRELLIVKTCRKYNLLQTSLVLPFWITITSIICRCKRFHSHTSTFSILNTEICSALFRKFFYRLDCMENWKFCIWTRYCCSLQKLFRDHLHSLVWQLNNVDDIVTRYDRWILTVPST